MSKNNKKKEGICEITQIRSYSHGRRTEYYPICPTCNIDIEYDYQKYCIFCGQALGWKKILYASIVPCHGDLTAKL